MYSLCTFSIVTVFGILAIYWLFGEGKGRAYTAEKLIPLTAFPYSLRQYMLHSVWDESREENWEGQGEEEREAQWGMRNRKRKKESSKMHLTDQRCDLRTWKRVSPHTRHSTHARRRQSGGGLTGKIRPHQSMATRSTRSQETKAPRLQFHASIDFSHFISPAPHTPEA